MKKFVSFILLIACVTALAGPGSFTVDDFEGLKLDKIPKTWRTWPFQRGKASGVYRVKRENGNQYLAASDGDGVSVQLFRNFDWEVKEKPIFSWRWRARKIPAGAQESDDNKNDSACGVYVIIGKFEGHAIKYVWSSSLRPGDVVTRKEGKLKIKVLDTGPKKLGKWQSHTVDVMKDFEALFGHPLKKKPSGMAILTDSNATHRPAACDYDDFVITGH